MGIPGASGELTWISLRAHPLIRTDEIAPHGVVMSFVDITEQRRRRTLSGILPICASCKKIRDAEGDWWPVEVYVRDHSEAEFSHGLCAECARHLRRQFRLME